MTAAKAKSRDVLEELIDVIGMPAAMQLSEAFAGLRVFVPQQKSMTPDHPIVAAIGMTAAAKLSARYAADTVIVPKRALREKRNARIVEAYQAGASARDLAIQYGLHEFTVYAIVAAAGANRRQMDMFE